MVVTDREQLIELAKVWDRGGRHIARSAATIALVAKVPEDERHRGLAVPARRGMTATVPGRDRESAWMSEIA